MIHFQTWDEFPEFWWCQYDEHNQNLHHTFQSQHKKKSARLRMSRTQRERERGRARVWGRVSPMPWPFLQLMRMLGCRFWGREHWPFIWGHNRKLPVQFPSFLQWMMLVPTACGEDTTHSWLSLTFIYITSYALENAS